VKKIGIRDGRTQSRPKAGRNVAQIAFLPAISNQTGAVDAINRNSPPPAVSVARNFVAEAAEFAAFRA